MFRQLIPCLALASLLAPLDPDINTRIRQEEERHSEIMRTLHYLTDVYGPRLTGTPRPEGRRGVGD